jgi:protein SCO1/2
MVVLAGWAVACGSSGGTGGGAAPQDYGALEDFTLTDQDGRAFGSAQLRGKPWIANFVFTQCPGVCPTLTAAMRAIQTRLAERHADVRLVTITVDPAHDTPEVLRGYAERYAADTRSWSFLTGERAVVHRVVINGFKQAVGDRAPAAGSPDAYDIMHSMKIVLVDGRGHLRGFFDTDTAGQAELFAALEAIAAEAQ